MRESDSNIKKLLRIKALVQTGINFENSVYDTDRYVEILELTDELISNLSNLTMGEVTDIHKGEVNYITPKVDVRTVITEDKKVLLVKEREDGHWALPGGWADVGYAPSAVAAKEVLEETGLVVDITRLLAIFDNSFHGHPPSPFYVYKLFFHGQIKSGSFDQKGHEVLDVGFFSLENLPPLSEERNTISQIETLLSLTQTDRSFSSLFD